jgi:hypothetical protein
MNRTLRENAGALPDPETVERMIAGAAMLRRAPRLAQVADVAAFLASDPGPAA